MRCLYCGKSLPLLKKLTGGGEFCSDAHRNKYQEEYNKLALSRLLQAQAPGSEGAPAAAAGGVTQQMRTMRALPAPMPRPGQKALPPPGGLPAPMPRPGMRALPAPATPPPTPRPRQAGEVRGAFPAPEAAPPPPGRTSAFAIPKAPAVEEAPKPKPAPDPPMAYFRMEIPKSKAPEAAVLRAVAMEGAAEWLPGLPELQPSPEFAVSPAEWESLVEAPDPDPPEAPAWDHPMTVRPAPEVRKLVAESVVEFPFHPLFPVWKAPGIAPVRPPVRTGVRLPMPVDFTAPGPAKPEAMPAGGGKWDLRAGLPAWRPRFTTILAPPHIAVESPAPAPVLVEEPPAMPAPTPQVEAAPVSEAVGEPVASAAKRPETGGADEVFIDLSLLGMLEESPAPTRRR